MTTEMRLADAAINYGGTLLNPDCRFSNVSIDSRKTAQGDLFVALQGERFDAHEFLPDVVTKAAGLVVCKAYNDITLPQWVVEDTTQALGQLAEMRRDQHRGSVIAITGSSGKTSVKEMTAAILRQGRAVHATAGNLNNHIGVPLTLLAMGANTDTAVLEMGASGAGEIAYLCNLAKPTVSLVNNVQHAHLEGFGSVEGIAVAKGEIYSGLAEQGTAVLNIDQKWSRDWRKLIGTRPCITFSLQDASADFGASEIDTLSNGCCRFNLHDRRGAKPLKQSVELSVPGLHSVCNALAAAACAAAAGADLKQISHGLAAVVPVSGRLNSIQLSEQITLIDDTYNANPDSFEAGIDVLKAMQGQTILVMGDMAELGEQAEEMHRHIGRYAQQAGIKQMFCVGEFSAFAAQAFAGNHFLSQQDLLLALQTSLHTISERRVSATVLVKGSRSSGMDRLITSLTEKGVLSC
jgi:UDP-N-acetylmuramoyl-tripeptide--D-alanyl-D-alanine ligase